MAEDIGRVLLWLLLGLVIYCWFVLLSALAFEVLSSTSLEEIPSKMSISPSDLPRATLDGAIACLSEKGWDVEVGVMPIDAAVQSLETLGGPGRGFAQFDRDVWACLLSLG